MTVDERIAGLVDLPESLASAFVRRHPAMASHSDELLNAATDALSQAARKFDAKRGKPFEFFARSCIVRRLAWTVSAIARRHKSQHYRAFATDADYDVAESRRTSTILPDDYYLRLTRHQIRILCLRFEGGYSFGQIARRCGCSKVNVYQIYRRGLKRIGVDTSLVT